MKEKRVFVIQKETNLLFPLSHQNHDKLHTLMLSTKPKVLMILLFFAVLFLVAFTIAEDNTAALGSSQTQSSNTEVDKSYSCLKSQLGDNCGNSQSTEQISFNLLAMAYDSDIQPDCKESLRKKKTGNCWGETSGSCTIKSTAMAILALNNIEEDADDSVNWLLTKRESRTGLTWFLEIDATNTTDCDINGRKVTVLNNKKISGSDPAGLIKSYNGYWYEITDISKNFTISCTNDFTSTLLYKKPGSNVFYVPSNSHSAGGGSSTTEKVESFCFTNTGQCDYEGTLWAAVALAKEGEDISPYLPYLSAMSDDSANKKYLPAAFLFMLTGADDYYSSLISQQIQGKYWDVSKRKLYDSSIALLALQGVNTQEVDNTRKHLLGIRDLSGCWNDVYTGFVLYAGWPKMPVRAGGGETVTTCQSYGYTCTAFGECSLENQMENFYCQGTGVCCKEQPKEESCSEKKGFACTTDQTCNGQEVLALDTNYCCIGSCEAIETQNQCEEAGGFCRDSCSTSEDDKTESYPDACEFGQKCCFIKEKKPINWWLIILLVILIILVILAIIFRNQVKIWVFRAKSGFKSGKGPSSLTRPGPPGYFPPPFRPMMPGPPRPATQRMYGRVPAGKTEKDKEFDDTMKKLREMSK